MTTVLSSGELDRVDAYWRAANSQPLLAIRPPAAIISRT